MRVDEDLSKCDYEMLLKLKSVARVVARTAEIRTRELGVTSQQHHVLLAIKGQPGADYANVRQIADSLQVTHQAAVGLVKRCVSSGLVRQQVDPTNRRQVRCYLTDRGETILLSLNDCDRAELDAMHRGFLRLLNENKVRATRR